MKIFYDHIRSYVVLCDPDNEIVEEKLNNYLIDLMDNIGDEQQNVQRINRKDQYLLVDGHANLRGRALIDAIKIFLKNHSIDYEEIAGVEISQHSTQHVDVSMGESGGGSADDTEQIENGIEPLVNVINEFDDIQTFASCEGHQQRSDHHAPAYVTWKATSLKGLNYSTFILKNAINEVWEKVIIENPKSFGSTQTINRILLTFHTSLWETQNNHKIAPVIGENFYKLTFYYQHNLQEKVFDIITNITKCIIKLNEKHKNN